jgi:hypothetical protein
MKTGRPSSYSQEIPDAICDEIATTDHGLERICRRDGAGRKDSLPCSAAGQWSVYGWLDAHSKTQDSVYDNAVKIIRFT